MMDGETRMRNGHESRVRLGQGGSRSEPSAKGVSVDSRPGVMIFSRRQQVLHVNHRALELTGQLHHAGIGSVNEICSAPVRELSVQICAALDIRKEAKISQLVEIRRLIFEAGRKILVYGFGLTGRNSFEDSRIVIVLKEIGPREERNRRMRRRGSFFLKSVAPFPENQSSGDAKAGTSDARAWGVSSTSPRQDRMGGIGISKGELT